eukprot:COSAG01_NODE_8457_length_2780_cov_3.509138_3_plen_99_part_00
MATINGARALGLADKIGSVTPGKDADLIAINLESVEASPMYDVVSHVVRHSITRSHTHTHTHTALHSPSLTQSLTHSLGGTSRGLALSHVICASGAVL